MVGIVVVSHSALVAEGVVELARQMGGDAAIAAAGGVDDEENPIGTDTTKVLSAIEEVWSDDGVVVIMDLGSAVLSADLAKEMIDEERRERVTLCDAPLVEGAVAAATAAGAGLPLAAVVAEARAGLAPKVAQLAAGAEEPPRETPPLEDLAGPSVVLAVANPTGLHARPAARFVATVGRFDARVTVGNVTTGAGPVRGDSFSAVGTLGARQGHEIRVAAAGPQAAAVLEALTELAAAGFGDELEAVPPTSPPAVAAPGGGVGASPGIAVGPVRRLILPAIRPDDTPAEAPDVERRRLEAAVKEARRDLVEVRRRVGGGLGEAEAGIFDAHVALLDDVELRSSVDGEIAAGAPAGVAWDTAIRALADRFRELPDPYQRERAADVESVGRRVLAALRGIDPTPAPSGEGILVAHDLDPAETAQLDAATVHGIVTAGGGPTSHSAILARALGIPAVVAAGPGVLDLDEGTTILVDGTTGRIVVDPEPAAVADARARQERERRQREAAAAAASSPAVTRDGHTVEVAANIGSVADAATAVASGADGVGLLRTEFLFLGSEQAPSEDEQEAAYRRIAETLDGRRLVLRTLDVGGDKPLPFLSQPGEANPFLGVRGIRIGLAEPDLLGAQLRAAVRVAADHPLSVMFPMVATLAELHGARAAVAEAIDATGVTPSPGFEVGVMAEVPAVAVMADVLAPHADFFSIGTNDLTQYVMAAERGNPRLADLADPLHPAVLRLIRLIAEAAVTHGRWVGVCGEAASDPIAVPVLLGLGVGELSASPAAVPIVKQAVRATDMTAARELAARALEADSATAVRDAVAATQPHPSGAG